MNKKNALITILLCIIFLLIGTVLGVLIHDKINTKTKTNEEIVSNNEVVEEKDLTKEELLDKLIGDWGTCEKKSCYGIIVGKKDTKVYTFLPYLMWSDGFASGIVTDVTKVDKDIYEITVYTAAYDNMESSGPEQINNYKINVSEISNNIIYISNQKYQKITGDRETFYNSIME